ncbi:MAG: HAMP domain-containing sensor histidine kinase [Anaerolineae bacterium]|jgi:signal transduction histidine kinase
MFRSIRWRLVLSYVLLVLLTLGVVGAVILRLVEDYVARQEQEQLASNAQAVARQARGLIWPVLRHAELQELAHTSSFLGDARVRILDSRHRELADSEGTGGQDAVWIMFPLDLQLDLPEGFPDPLAVELPHSGRLVVPASWEEQSRLFERLPPEAALTLLRWQDRVWGRSFELHLIQNREQLQELAEHGEELPRSPQVLTLPVGEPGAPLGYVELSQGPDFVSDVLETTRKAFAYAALGAMALAILVGLVVSRGLVAPLRELTGVAGQMSGGDLSTRAPVRRKDEIGQLAGQFNQMAGRLEVSFAELASERDALRRFIADASHELRTPITALKNFNHLLQGPAAGDPAARAEFLAESQVQLDRLEWVTGNLLDLSRLDAGLVALELARHDVGDLVASAATVFKPLARDKEIDLAVRLPEPPTEIQCDRARIELALGNLLDNAYKFTPAGGQVEVGAETAGEIVRLWVRDSGPGIDPDEQEHIFERFYRGSTTTASGSGLGLAIVQSIAQAHGGRVTVESDLGAGSLFVIELPSTAYPPPVH